MKLSYNEIGELVPNEQGDIEVDDSLIADRSLIHLAVVYSWWSISTVLSFSTEVEVEAAFRAANLFIGGKDCLSMHRIILEGT